MDTETNPVTDAQAINPNVQAQVDTAIERAIQSPYDAENEALEAAAHARQLAENVKTIFLKTAIKAIRTDKRRAAIANRFIEGINYNAIAMESLPNGSDQIEKQTQFRLGVALGDLTTIDNEDVVVFAVKVPTGMKFTDIENMLVKKVGSNEAVVSKSYFATASPDAREKMRSTVYDIIFSATLPECSNAANNPPYYEYLDQARQIVAVEDGRIE